MRRSICYTEPAHVFAGNKGTWRFVYTPSQYIPQGSRLKFDLLSKSRPIDWETPSTNLKDKSSVLWVSAPNHDLIKAKKTEDENLSQYEFTLPSEVKAGEKIIIHIGQLDPKIHLENHVQKIVQRKRSFHLYVDPKGKGDYKDPETFHMDIRGGLLHTLRVIAPSVVTRNKRFDVIVRFEDEYGNLTSNAPEGTLIDLSYEHLRDSLNWKLFVPETGFINLPNLYFNEPGIYKIRLINLLNNKGFLSPFYSQLSGFRNDSRKMALPLESHQPIRNIILVSAIIWYSRFS